MTFDTPEHEAIFNKLLADNPGMTPEYLMKWHSELKGVDGKSTLDRLVEEQQ